MSVVGSARWSLEHTQRAVRAGDGWGTWRAVQGWVGDGEPGGELSCARPSTQDLPSFTQNLHRLVNDLRYYRLCNDSLPPGTVKL